MSDRICRIFTAHSDVHISDVLFRGPENHSDLSIDVPKLRSKYTKRALLIGLDRTRFSDVCWDIVHTSIIIIFRTTAIVFIALLFIYFCCASSEKSPPWSNQRFRAQKQPFRRVWCLSYLLIMPRVFMHTLSCTFSEPLVRLSCTQTASWQAPTLAFFLFPPLSVMFVLKTHSIPSAFCGECHSRLPYYSAWLTF